MKKYFLENNQIRKQLSDKFHKTESRNFISDYEKIQYLEYLLALNGSIFYVQDLFDIEKFQENLKIYFEQKDKVEIQEQQYQDVKIFHIKGGQKVAKFLGLTKPISIIFKKRDNILSYYFLPTSWFEDPKIDPSIEKQSLISGLFVDNIENFILEYINSTIEKKLFVYATNDNYFIEGFNSRFQQFFISERIEKEILLAWLKVGSIKNLGQNKDYYKKLSWYYLLSNNESLLLGFNNNGDILEAFNFQDRQIKIKKSIRNTIVIDKYEWFPTINNSSKYKLISKATTMSAEQRINYFSRINFSNSKDNRFAKFLAKETGFITTDLTLFYIDYLSNPSQTIESYSKDERLMKILSEILKNPQAEEALVFWYNDWQPDIKQSAFIIKMLSEAAEDEKELKKLLPLHKIIHEYLIKKEKDSYNKILYDIEYSRHLIVLGNFSEAEKILKRNLKKLPDMSLTELLPAENIDPTGNLSGQFLKVIILELLSKTKKDKNSADFIRKAAILQPLSQERIYELSTVADNTLSTKARKVLEIIKGGNLIPDTSIEEVKYKAVSLDLVEKIKHPVYSKKGNLSKFSKWLSSYKTPDFSTMKDLAEKFSPQKHKEIADIIADILRVFNIPNLEIFIAHGDQSVGITAYEATTPFLIIGAEHINPDSAYFLTHKEMTFAIAQEIAFIYFKFARITSSDIWRGAMEKGNFVVDTLMDIIPFIGSISNVLKKATKVKQVANFMDKNSKISSILTKGQQIDKIANKSQGILVIASDMLGSLSSTKNNKKETQKLDEIIAISRMMQLTADRAGLLFCNNPASAVRSVFLTSKNLYDQLPTIQKYGLNSFLLKKDEKENFVNLNFAVRFASMFSFWLSDDFENIRSLMLEKQ